MAGVIRQHWETIRGDVTRGWDLIQRGGPAQLRFWFIALGLGVVSGFGAIGFRYAVETLQALLYGTDDLGRLASWAGQMHWIWVLAIPVAGGLAVGLILQRFTPDGRVERRAGLASVLCSWITLSTGGSTGREGPVVHMAALASTWIANRLKVDGITGRDLLGCAVAAAVSASFNAPIAGALFALEVVLRHFAFHAFAPIVVASAAGTVINRLVYGNVTEFVLPGTTTVEFYLELPAFFLLGLICGVVAVVMMRAIFFADDVETEVQRRLGLPRWARPAVAGLLLGALAIWFPHIIGVGYETTSRALSGELLLGQAFVFAVVKVVAVSLTMAGRMGGGIFSPSLMVGALTGLTFGHIATGVLPEMSSAFTLYALAGMGAVAAAVLGAPISTTLIVFELTGDWQTGLAVMVSVSMSTALASRVVDRSFFLTQLERRKVALAAGPQSYLLGMFRVKGVMRRPTDENAADEATCLEMIESGLYVQVDATLKTALPQLDMSGSPFLPVVAMEGTTPVLQGALFHVDALKAYNRALAATAEEEHS